MLFTIWSYLSFPLPRYMVIKQQIQNFFLLNLNFKICKWILRLKKKQTKEKGIFCLIFFLPICMFDLEHTVWRKNSSKYNNLLIMIALVLITNKLFRTSGSFLWFQINFFLHGATSLSYTRNCKCCHFIFFIASTYLTFEFRIFLQRSTLV